MTTNEAAVTMAGITRTGAADARPARMFDAGVAQDNAAQLGRMSDAALLARVRLLAGREREATAALVASLGQVDARKLYLGEGCSSLFTYCTERLQMGEGAAYRRIEAARAARRFPAILARLESGELTLAAAVMVAPHLTDANCEAVLGAVRHQSKRRVEEIVAGLRPRPDVCSSVRKLPTPRAEEAQVPAASVGVVPLRETRSIGEDATATGSDLLERGGCAAGHRPPAHAESAVAAIGGMRESSECVGEILAASGVCGTPEGRPRPAVVRPLAPARYQIQITVSAETHGKLRQAQALLRHAIPDGDPAQVVDRALTALIRDLERVKCAAVRQPREVREAGKPTEARKASNAREGGAARNADHRSAACEAGQSPGGPSGRAGGARPGSHAEAFGNDSNEKTRGRERRPRHIPARVKREVWRRDEARCAFVSADGMRCTERGRLEFHHKVPWAAGGAATVENIEIRCSAHNRHEAVRYFGEEVVGPQLSPG